MFRRPVSALLASLTCFAGVVLTGIATYLVPAARVRDSASLHGFVGLGGPRLDPVLGWISQLAGPAVYAALGIALVAGALARRRPLLGAVVAGAIVCAPLTSEALKPLLAQPRHAEWLGPGGQVTAASWPSGHATAAMTIALCAVLVAPAVLRPLAAVAGGLYAVAVSFSILVLAWHFPSDIVGGYLVAAAWVLLGVAALRRWPAAARERASGRPMSPALAAAPAAALAALAVGVGAGVAFERPRAIASYVADRPSFAFAAAAIAALAAVLATALARSDRV